MKCSNSEAICYVIVSIHPLLSFPHPVLEHS